VGTQPGVAVVHHRLQPQQGGDRVGEVGADELVGHIRPVAQLDELAVKQHEAGVTGQGGVCGDQVEQAGLAAAGFATGEQVAVDQLDVDRAPNSSMPRWMGSNIDRAGPTGTAAGSVVDMARFLL
jgi:hypothetical protein